MNSTLEGTLAPYRHSYIADALKRRGFTTTRSTVHAWAKGDRIPDVRVLPALAEILGIDVGELTRIIAGTAAVA